MKNKQKKALTEVYSKGTPLKTAGMEISVLHMQVPGAHCLRPQSVEQGHLGA